MRQTASQAALYNIRRARQTPELKGLWKGPAWADAPPLAVANFHAKSSAHRPVVQAKLVFDDQSIYVIFRVLDRYVRSVQVGYQQSVCTDSCVEFFVQPKPDKGYFNFEINCGGAMLCYYIEDPTFTDAGFKKYSELSAAQLDRVKIYHSMPAVVEPEIKESVEWRNEFAIPLDLLEEFVSPLRPLSGSQWRGNLYKCADKTSMPHWASWTPMPEILSFHQPKIFGTLRFA